MSIRTSPARSSAALALIASAAFVVLSQPLKAQGGRRSGGGFAAAGCVSPLPPPAFGAAGGFGMGGRGGRGRGGPPPDSMAARDSSRAGRGRGARGCPPFFPDSLALTAAQKQQIVALRAAFAQAHASELAQLQTIAQNARAARQAGQTTDQVRAIMAQAEPIRTALQGPAQQVQAQVEATLTAGQAAWMQAHGRQGRRGRPGIGRGDGHLVSRLD